MIPFFEKTWFAWWILATVIILRWFYVFFARAGESDLTCPEIEVRRSLPSGDIVGPQPAPILFCQRLWQIWSMLRRV